MSTGLKRMMLTVSDERNKLTAVIANIPSGLIMTDSEKKVVLANAAAGKLYGFPEAEAPGRSVIEVVHDHEIEALLGTCLRTERTHSTQVESAGGRFLRVIAVPLMVDRKNGALVILQDLTEMRNLQVTRQEFVGNISHELKTPLAAIKAIVETLQDGALHDESVAGSFLSRAGAEVDGMTQMVDELIELSRVESGRATLNLVETDLNDVAREVVSRLLPQAERSRVVLSAALSPGLPRVLADRERIHQALANIVHNAVKFTSVGGRVTVSSALHPDSVTISVADTGVGISKQDLPHVFERFFKADRSRSGGGTGLGLAVARHIVNAHKGDISVQSVEGKGSTFTISLPLGRRAGERP
jgi:two-component system phosphate regulon sensor histidine kinase PhoR